MVTIQSALFVNRFDRGLRGYGKGVIGCQKDSLTETLAPAVKNNS